jgi:hypothetical protein
MWYTLYIKILDLVLYCYFVTMHFAKYLQTGTEDGISGRDA